MKQHSKWFALSVLVSILFIPVRESAAKSPFPFMKNDRIVIIGNTFGERMTATGFFESSLQQAFPTNQMTLRSLCWPADELSRVEAKNTKAMESSGEPHSNGNVVLFQPRPLNFGDMFKYLKEQDPDVLVLCFGMTESFNGPSGVKKFQQDFSQLVAKLEKLLGDKKKPLRLIAVSPIAHESLEPELPNPESHNKNLELYTAAMNSVCKQKEIGFIDLFHPTLKKYKDLKADKHLTINGIHLNNPGNQFAAKVMMEQLGYPLRNNGPAKSPLFEKLRQEVVKKNQLFYYRYRAVNGEYIYGRRKDPFGTVNFPGEMKELDRLATKTDEKIHSLAAQVQSSKAN